MTNFSNPHPLQHSTFWRQPVVAWLWLHIPDLVGVLFLILFAAGLWFAIRLAQQYF